MSLERRLMLALVAALVLVFAGLFWGSVTVVRSISEAYILTRLEHDAEALLAAVGPNPMGVVKLREGRITPIYRQPLSGHYYVVTWPDGSLSRSRSLWDESLDIPQVSTGDVVVVHRQGPADQLLQMRVAGYEKNGLRFSIAVAEDLTAMKAEIGRFQLVTLVALAGVLLLIIGVQRIALRRGFRSLDAVRAQMHEISDGARQRLEAMGPVEVRPLTSELNRLLAQVELRLQRSRQALGNLAHALKGPLSVLTRTIDALPVDAAERGRLNTQLTRVQTLIDRELKRARFAGEGVGQFFNPREQLPELIEALQQMYRERDLDIVHGELPAGRLPFDHEDMLELLGNLMDNACKWAKQRVEVQLTRGADLQVRVADDGPGVTSDQYDKLMRRGGRLDEQEAGHGLGLAIVKDLVSDYGGEMTFAKSALGGLEVSVTLPLPTGSR
ncbi:sensor histidine kinase [Thiosocius teredinicola]|uniref:sensor histidine kinase n=1 Tax=Thiosocius teredinicola TaxID=1973002 RepID=UPI000990BA40